MAMWWQVVYIYMVIKSCWDSPVLSWVRKGMVWMSISLCISPGHTHWHNSLCKAYCTFDWNSGIAAANGWRTILKQINTQHHHYSIIITKPRESTCVMTSSMTSLMSHHWCHIQLYGLWSHHWCHTHDVSWCHKIVMSLCISLCQTNRWSAADGCGSMELMMANKTKQTSLYHIIFYNYYHSVMIATWMM